MTNANDKETLKMMRRLKGEICRPIGISSDNPAYRRCMDEGLVKFNEWPSGHYSVTDKGRSFARDFEDA